MLEQDLAQFTTCWKGFELIPFISAQYLSAKGPILVYRAGKQ